MHHVANRGKIDFKKLKKGSGGGIAEPDKFAIGLKAVIKYGSNEYTGARIPPKSANLHRPNLRTRTRSAPTPVAT